MWLSFQGTCLQTSAMSWCVLEIGLCVCLHGYVCNVLLLRHHGCGEIRGRQPGHRASPCNYPSLREGNRERLTHPVRPPLIPQRLHPDGYVFCEVMWDCFFFFFLYKKIMRQMIYWVVTQLSTREDCDFAAGCRSESEKRESCSHILFSCFE